MNHEPNGFIKKITAERVNVFVSVLGVSGVLGALPLGIKISGSLQALESQVEIVRNDVNSFERMIRSELDNFDRLLNERNEWLTRSILSLQNRIEKLENKNEPHGY